MSKLVSFHAMKTYRGSRGTAPPILNAPGNIVWYPFNWRLGGPQSRSGRFYATSLTECNTVKI